MGVQALPNADGTMSYVNVPDGVDLNAHPVVQNTIQSFEAAKARQTQEDPLKKVQVGIDQTAQFANHMGQNFGRNVLQGVTDIPTMFMDGMASFNGVDHGDWTNKSQSKVGDFSTNAEAEKLINSVTPQGEPNGAGEKIIGAGVRGAASAITPGGGGVVNMLRNAVIGGSSGAGGEIAGQFVDHPVARLLGALGGSLIPGVASTATVKNTVDLIKEATRGMSMEELLKAMDTQKAAYNRAGVALNTAQATDRVTGLDALVKILSTHRSGNAVQDQLHNQLQNADKMAEMSLLDVPGKVNSPTIANNNAQVGATGAIQDAKRYIKGVVDPMYDAVGPVSNKTIKTLITFLDNIGTKPGTSEGLVDLAGQLKKNILENPKMPASKAASPDAWWNAYADKGTSATPMTHALDLKTMFTTDLPNVSAKLVQSGKTAVSTGEIKKLRGELMGILGEGSPELAAANKMFGDLKDRVLNPLTESVVGKVAGANGYVPGTAGPTAAWNVLNKGESPAIRLANGQPAGDISQMAHALNKNNPETFQNLVTSWLHDRVTRALENPTGVIEEGTPKRVAQAMVGENATVANGIKLALEKSGAHPDVYENLQLAGRAGRRPSNVSDVAGQTDAAGRNLALEAGKFHWNPLRGIATHLQQSLSAKSFEEASHMLTTPEGTQKLIETMNSSGMTTKQKASMAAILGLSGNVNSAVNRDNNREAQ